MSFLSSSHHLSLDVRAVILCCFVASASDMLAHCRVELVYSLHLPVCLSSILLLTGTTQESGGVVLFSLCIALSMSQYLCLSFPLFLWNFVFWKWWNDSSLSQKHDWPLPWLTFTLLYVCTFLFHSLKSGRGQGHKYPKWHKPVNIRRYVFIYSSNCIYFLQARDLFFTFREMSFSTKSHMFAQSQFFILVVFSFFLLIVFLMWLLNVYVEQTNRLCSIRKLIWTVNTWKRTPTFGRVRYKFISEVH